MNAPKEEILEKIVADFTARLRKGELPAIVDYQKRYPDLSGEIDDLLASVAMIEGLKGPASGPSKGTLQKDVDHLLSLERLGDYRIIRQLGRGGMGIVLEAEHESLGRPVAIKVLPARLVTDEKALERFRREARAAANLHHTNIVGVFGVGQSEGYHYYVMELVRGLTVSQVIRDLRGQSTPAEPTIVPAATRVDNSAPDAENTGEFTTADTNTGGHSATRAISGATDVFRKSAVSDYSNTGNARSADNFTLHNAKGKVSDIKNRYRWAASVAAQTADAMKYAHGLNVLHRDIKPANLMLDETGTVWVTDFGLVKNITNQTLTATGDIVGTPQYMAPESFEGRYDQRSETYCLGLTLYEMATLRPAYADASTPELIRAITSTAPERASKVDPGIPRDLATIIQKAISREQENRYQTADALLSDLRAFLDDRPIKARRASTVEYVWRWSRRNPLVASLLALSIVLTGIIAIVASAGYISTRNAYSALNRKHQNLIEQEQATERARQEVTQEFERAESNRIRAEENYRRAEGNVNLMMEMFDDMFNQIVFRGKREENATELEGFQQLSAIETTVTSRDAEFLESMLGFYRKFAMQNEDNADLRDEAVKAYRRVAHIYALTGEYAEAETAYRQAIREYAKLVREDPGSYERTVNLTRTLTELGSAMIRGGKFKPNADKEFQRAIDALDAHPEIETNRMQIEKARTLLTWADVVPVDITRESFAQLEAGYDLVPQEIILREQARNNGNQRPRQGTQRQGTQRPGTQRPGNAQQRPGGQRPGSQRPGGQRNGSTQDEQPGQMADNSRPFSRFLGSGVVSRTMRDRFEEDRQRLQDAIRILENVLSTEADNMDARFLLARCWCSDAQLAFSIENDVASNRSLSFAISDLERLSEVNPENPEYLFTLAEAYSMPVSDNADENERRLEQARVIMERLIEDAPRKLEYLQLQAQVFSELGYMYRDSGDFDAALEYFKLANEAFNTVIDEVPALPQVYFRRLVVDLNYFVLLFRENRFDEATRMARVSRNSLRQFRGRNQRAPEQLSKLKEMYDRMLRATNPLTD
ncbi:MAG: protein kinase [Planctomycetota bacterium]